MKREWTKKDFPKMTAMKSELENMSDADVVEMLINDERDTTLHFYFKRLGRDLCVAVFNRKAGEENAIELPDGTLVVFNENP